MKKLYVLTISTVMLVACGENKEKAKTDDDSQNPSKEVTTEESSPNVTTVVENSSTSNASIALDDYEAYVNEYLEIVSNIKNGNAEEWKRYEEFSGQADQLGITLSELSTEFTEEQAERYQELNQKITDAAMSLYK